MVEIHSGVERVYDAKDNGLHLCVKYSPSSTGQRGTKLPIRLCQLRIQSINIVKDSNNFQTVVHHIQLFF